MNDYTEKKDKEFDSMIDELVSLSKLYAIVSSVYQFKRTEEKVEDKTSNEENVLIYGINEINSKVLTNTKKYESITGEKDSLLEEYKNLLSKKGGNYDGIILHGHMKLFDEELNQIKMFKEIYELKKEESLARSKADNSDDEIAEIIYDKEEEISKSESKIRRIKNTINAKIKEKDLSMQNAMESEEKSIQKEVKGPRIFSGAKKFFLGRINPKKMIEKDVFSGFRNRIEEYKESEISKIRQNEKYTESNLLKLATDIENKKR